MIAGLNILVSFLFGGLRILGEKSEMFQAFSHLYVGGLYGFAIACWWFGRYWKFSLALAVLLSLLELACFLLLSRA